MDNSKIYVFEDKGGVADSTRHLLQSRAVPVNMIKTGTPPANYPEFHNRDTILIHLHDDEPDGFRLLNDLMFEENTPHIVVTTVLDALIQPTDCFPGANVTVLSQPVSPRALVAALSLH